MDEKEALKLVRELIAQKLHANQIRERLGALSPELLTKFNAIPRKNIREFVTRCSQRFNVGSFVADIGCGYRTNREELLSSQQHSKSVHYIGVDHTESFDHVSDHEGVDFVIGDAMNIPLPDGSVSTVICTECIEHVPDDSRALAEMRRVIQPGGLLILTVPGRDIPNHEKLPHQIDYRRYTSDQLQTLLSENGFGFVEMQECFYEGLSLNLMCTAQAI